MEAAIADFRTVAPGVRADVSFTDLRLIDMARNLTGADLHLGRTSIHVYFRKHFANGQRGIHCARLCRSRSDTGFHVCLETRF